MTRRSTQQPLFSLPSAPRPVSRSVRASVRSKALSPSPRPWSAVVLAVDTAARSGWAIAVQGERVDSGELDTLDFIEIERVVRWAIELGQAGGLKVVLVLEAPYGGSVSVVAALGVARERWERAWRDAGQTVRRIVRVQPTPWRVAVLGRQVIGMRRAAVRALEQRVARALIGKALGDEEAPAVLIARWAAYAGAVGKAIGVRGRRASLKAWMTKS